MHVMIHRYDRSFYRLLCSLHVTPYKIGPLLFPLHFVEFCRCCVCINSRGGWIKIRQIHLSLSSGARYIATLKVAKCCKKLQNYIKIIWFHRIYINYSYPSK